MFDSFLNTVVYNDKTVGDIIAAPVLIDLFSSVLGAIALLILGYTVAGWISRQIRRIGLKYQDLDDTLFSFFANIARYAIITFTVVFILSNFGVETTSIAAAIGAASLAIGLALQGTLSNVAAGVMIVFFRPFRLGDVIETNGVLGTVKDITLNYTEIADLSNVQVIVPNAVVWGNVITNYSANGTRRAEWLFGVGYGADLKTAETVIRDTILTDPRALADPEPFIQVNNLGDFSVDFLVRVWCLSEDYFAFQADMKRKVKEALDQAGVDIPFPTTTMITKSADE